MAFSLWRRVVEVTELEELMERPCFEKVLEGGPEP